MKRKLCQLNGELSDMKSVLIITAKVIFLAIPNYIGRCVKENILYFFLYDDHFLTLKCAIKEVKL